MKNVEYLAYLQIIIFKLSVTNTAISFKIFFIFNFKIILISSGFQIKTSQPLDIFGFQMF